MFDDLSNADVANAMLSALEHELIDVSTVRRWADQLIESSEVAPEWMIDLSFSTARDVDHHLRAVPGEVDIRRSEDLLLCLTYLAFEGGRLDTQQLRNIGWRIYSNHEKANSDHWGLHLELAIESQRGGSGGALNIQEAIEYAKHALAKYSVNVPSWIFVG